jgi:hypothetical protein
MKSAHAGRGITDAEFDPPVGDLLTTLNTCPVGERQHTMLLSVLSSMGQDILERRYSPS